MSTPRRRLLRRVLRVLGVLALAALALVGGLRLWVWHAFAARTYGRVADVPVEDPARVAIVLGAGLRAGGEPSPVLYDRVAAAAELYRAGRVRKLLLSGDNRVRSHDEPKVMRQVAQSLGVPDRDLVLDYAGRHTYDTCYRSRAIFGVRRAVLVTQGFHLDRALYLCNGLGVDAIGLVADRQAYPRSPRTWWWLREVVATSASWIDLHLTHPVPVLGAPIPVEDAS